MTSELLMWPQLGRSVYGGRAASDVIPLGKLTGT